MKSPFFKLFNGQPCGGSHIADSKTCHAGAGQPAKPVGVGAKFSAKDVGVGKGTGVRPIMTGGHELVDFKGVENPALQAAHDRHANDAESLRKQYFKIGASQKERGLVTQEMRDIYDKMDFHENAAKQIRHELEDRNLRKPSGSVFIPTT